MNLLSIFLAASLGWAGATGNIDGATRDFLNELNNLDDWDFGKVSKYFDENAVVYAHGQSKFEGVEEIYRSFKAAQLAHQLNNINCENPLIDEAKGFVYVNCEMSGTFSRTQKSFNNVPVRVIMGWNVVTNKLRRFAAIPIDNVKTLEAAMTDAEKTLLKMKTYPNWCGEDTDEIQDKFFTSETEISCPNLFLTSGPEKFHYKGENALEKFCQDLENIFDHDDDQGPHYENFRILYGNGKKVIYMYTHPNLVTKEGADISNKVWFVQAEFNGEKLKCLELVASSPLLPWEVSQETQKWLTEEKFETTPVFGGDGDLPLPRDQRVSHGSQWKRRWEGRQSDRQDRRQEGEMPTPSRMPSSSRSS